MKKMIMAGLVMAVIGMGLATKLMAPPTYKATNKPPKRAGFFERVQGSITYFRSNPGSYDKASYENLLHDINEGHGISADQQTNLRNQLNALPKNW